MSRLAFALCSFLVISHLSAGENPLENMEKEKVVPDVIDKLPTEVAEVSFPSGATVNVGGVLTPTQVKDAPTVKWNAAADGLYAVCMTDPDAPSRANRTIGEWHHWFVGNVPGGDISKGEVLRPYIGAGPPKDTGLHRCVILVYKQPKELTFDDLRLPNTTYYKRKKFSIKKFAEKYGLEGPVAGNFFQAEWDDYVPELYKQFALKKQA